MITRRSFLTLSAGAAAVAATGSVLSACSPGAPTPESFNRELPIPPTADSEVIDGVRVFHLTAQEGTSEIVPGKQTTTWGFNGPHFGPTVVASRGERVRLEFENRLDEMTTMHIHGMKLPAIMDGGPHSPIEPGETWTTEFTIDQPAATVWYHPHPHEATGLHAYRGLAGGFVITDEDMPDIPADYGVDDIPLILQDHRFNEDGSFDETDLPDLGLLGDTPNVNGCTNPVFHATTSQVRFRLVNGSNMRFHNLALSDDRPFTVVATDTGFLPHPVEVKRLPIGPGERFEIIVDLEQGEEIFLRSVGFPHRLGLPKDDSVPDFGVEDTYYLLRIVGPQDAQPPQDIPDRLVDAEDVVPETGFQRSFALNTFEINGKRMDMQRVDFVIDHDTPEQWTVTNENSDWIHNFHIHDASFMVLDAPDTDEVWTQGWKDTVTIPPETTVTLAVTFGNYPDPAWPYMYHCHMLYHEDNGMMGQFVITEPGGAPAASIGAGAEHSHHN